MPTLEKEKILRETGEKIAGVKGIYLADLSGMTVEKVSLLRKKCRGEKIQVKVIKNTLLKRAFNERGIKELDPHLVGPTGLVFSPVNEMAPAKILSDFAKEFEKPRVKAAVVDGRLYDTKAIATLAKLPSREVLLSQLIGTFVAPMSNFLGAINALLATPANMADALAKEKAKAS